MTRNNLDTHVSWLLSSKVTPPVGVHTRSEVATKQEGLEIFGIHAEDLEALEEVDLDLVSSPVRERVRSPPPPRTIARPPPIRPPPRISNGTDEVSRSSSVAVMRRHDSGPKSTASGVMSQYQLATPASTTTSTAAPSSLAANYTQMLMRENGGTPISHAKRERLQSRPSRSDQVPQTPRHTPRPTIESHLRNIESVDLTGDLPMDTGEPRSSSTEVILRKGHTVWTPSAAARPEPIPKTSKKRKSDDISGVSARKRMIRSPDKSRQNDTDLEGFMDIDDLMPSQSLSQRSVPRPKAVKKSVETPVQDVGVEVEVTETISRTETRTRKSISRVPSMTEVLSGRRNSGEGEQSFVPKARSSQMTSPAKAALNIQVEGSPIMSKAQSRVGSSPTPTSRMKQERKPQRNIIQDSDEDDDMLLDDAGSSCSPRRAIKASPQISSVPASPQAKTIPDHKPKLHVYRDPSPRTTSPLRAISKNLVDRIHSPAPKHSPSRSISAVTPSTGSREQTVNSSLSSDDKILVNRFLTDPSLIDSYYNRVKSLKAQSAADCMAYTDNFEKVPTNLREERMRILDMEKAYQNLEKIANSYQELKAEKKTLARQIAHDLELDLDTSVAEDRQAVISKFMRDKEREVGDLLHTSGAIDDGFGTELPKESRLLPPKSSFNTTGSVQTTTGSSTIGSGQVILQTQFPTLHQRQNSRSVDEATSMRGSPRRDSRDKASRYRGSPSPVRRQIQPSVQNARSTGSTFSDRPRQQSTGFSRTTPETYGDDDDEEYFQQMIEEEEQRTDHATSKPSAEDLEDDYGDDDDDDDLIEAAQNFESLPSRSNTGSSTLPRTPGLQAQSEGKARADSDMYAHVDSSESDQMNFPWSKEVKKALRERFKLRGFRQNQLDAINATLAGKDAFVLMPTGGGKSLCYQLPAIVNGGKTRGVTVVISPLLSLMSDQVDHLTAKHIQAFLVNGEQSKDQRNIVFNGLSDPHAEQLVQVLYVTPEMIGKSGQLDKALRSLHQRKILARIVIDEAHCVSQWGHDFRPDYKTLADLRNKFPGVPFMALTATATQNVKADCIHNLGMEGCKEYKQSFNRPNLFYEIRPKIGKGSGAATVDAMIELIKETHKKQTGIVYTLSKKNCEDLAATFVANGISAHHFHAGMPPDEKSRVQRAWQTGEYQVVVATIAFGMGIDKADVRFVIHHTIPKSLEGYYQETGRAGRDGKPSRCYLFYGFQDTTMLRRFIEDSEGDQEVKESQRAMLKYMVRYCENRNDCRRSNILAYFGESFSKENCNNMCDNCASDAVYETLDMTELAKSALKIVEKFYRDNLTLLYVVDLLRGAGKAKPNHQDIRKRGLAKDLPRGEVERLLTRLLMEDILEENNVINKSGFATAYLKIGTAADDFKRSKRRLKLPVKVSKSPHGPTKVAVKPATKRKAAPPASTMFTSPISPSSRRGVARPRAQRSVPDDSEDDNSFVVADDDESEDGFEIRKPARSRSKRKDLDVGPPIVVDEAMQHLTEIHQDVVEEFVNEAKRLEDKLRHQHNHRTKYFREVDFREMAIRWTLSLRDMKEIDGIDQDKVERYGKRFLPLIEKCFNHYEEMTGVNDRDMDENHRNVIDLCDDDDDAEADEEGEDDQYEEEQSRFFMSDRVHNFNQQMAQAERAPKPRNERHVDVPKPAARGGYRKGSRGGRGGGGSFKKPYPRKSTDSSGTASTSRSRVSKSKSSGGGVPRKNSSASAAAAPMRGSIMQSFGRQVGGGSGSSSVMGMPI